MSPDCLIVSAEYFGGGPRGRLHAWMDADAGGYSPFTAGCREQNGGEQVAVEGIVEQNGVLRAFKVYQIFRFHK